ncbi:hypothetical protein [Geodermatophilus tzadiensis]|uniref:hypothetical protein n=1 Tax=Geodermatophilus tzadiensis TaxID=1137988 RepID=UPI001B807530|nr:hypothetical protein [Geodermatophilus tzadiensis]
MIEAHELTERHGDTTAVHPSAPRSRPGPSPGSSAERRRHVHDRAHDHGTGPADVGTVIANGKPYPQHRASLREGGALLEASAVHPSRSSRSHLLSMAATHDIEAARVSEVIEMTGRRDMETGAEQYRAAGLVAAVRDRFYRAVGRRHCVDGRHRRGQLPARSARWIEPYRKSRPRSRGWSTAARSGWRLCRTASSR